MGEVFRVWHLGRPFLPVLPNVHSPERKVLFREKASTTVRISASRSDMAVSNPNISSDAQYVSYLVKEGDTLTAIAKKSRTTVRLLADANNIADVDFLRSGQLLKIPTEAAGHPRSNYLPVDEFPISRKYDWRSHSQNTSSQQGHVHDVLENKVLSSKEGSQRLEAKQFATSVWSAPGLSFPGLAVPLLLLAPLLGFCIRCIVDSLHADMDLQEAKQQAEREQWEVLHRPKAERWQKILDEDREGIEPDVHTDEEPTTRNAWTGGDTWIKDVNLVEKSLESIQSETDEELRLRHQQDYEEIRKSYSDLESSYAKFLADSGMSMSGYWRGSEVPTSAHLDDGESLL